MGKIAFVFSGQGAHYPGMGRELADRSPAARAVFAAADALRSGTSAQCFSASMEELCETKNTQPCMFAVELAAAAALREAGIRADMAAGFSLGELAALTYGCLLYTSTRAAFPMRTIFTPQTTSASAPAPPPPARF